MLCWLCLHSVFTIILTDNKVILTHYLRTIHVSIIFKMIYAHTNYKAIFVAYIHCKLEVASSNPVTPLYSFLYFIDISLIQLFEYISLSIPNHFGC